MSPYLCLIKKRTVVPSALTGCFEYALGEQQQKRKGTGHGEEDRGDNEGDVEQNAGTWGSVDVPVILGATEIVIQDPHKTGDLFF